VSASVSARIETLNARDLPKPGGHYSHICTYNGITFIAGQLPIDADGRAKADKPFTEQTRQVLDNIDACLREAGLSRRSILQVRVFITDMNKWGEFDGVYSEWIGEHRPARIVAGVSDLHFGSLVEIEVVAGN
jgi:2-iminobutanoate/2-iminopropanoate deaminase